MDTDTAEAVTPRTSDVGADADADVLALFAVLWAAVTLFHVWGPSGAAFHLFDHQSRLGLLQAAAGIVAIAVIVRPRSLPLLAALTALGPMILWYEMPITGSHWVVASFVDVAFLLTLVVARNADRVASIFIPLARWVLIVFYFFAAFAKYNHAFFTPSVSCGNYYFDELTGSLGLTVHSAAASWSHVVPIGVALIEMSIPFLLLVRRTRYVGVVTGLLFHGVIAFDQTHLFSDFSSVLAALFTLFLPAAFARGVIVRFRRLPRRDEVRGLIAAAAAVLLLVQWKQGNTRLFRDGIGWAWVVLLVTLLAVVALFLRNPHPPPDEHPLRLGHNRVPLWMAIIPVLVLLTGLSPYLELRTAYAFNMYSNLQTANGESNHLLVTRTVPLTDFESDLVRIKTSSDAGLQLYASGQFDLPFLQLRDYLSRHQEVSLTYVRGGVEHSVARASDDAALVEPVPAWESRLFAFRALDQTDPARCQPSFLPAL